MFLPHTFKLPLSYRDFFQKFIICVWFKYDLRIKNLSKHRQASKCKPRPLESGRGLRAEGCISLSKKRCFFDNERAPG